jgi:hypothetical protein
MEIPFDNDDESTTSMACCTSTGMFAESYLDDSSESLMFADGAMMATDLVRTSKRVPACKGPPWEIGARPCTRRLTFQKSNPSRFVSKHKYLCIIVQACSVPSARPQSAQVVCYGEYNALSVGSGADELSCLGNPHGASRPLAKRTNGNA